jgi:MoaA/NifB/PqqE/SkfB family radical SAM enzyme
MLEFVTSPPVYNTFAKSHISSVFSSAGVSALKLPFMRDLVMAYIKTNLSFGNYDAIIKTYPPVGVKRDMAWYVYSFFKTVDKAIRERRISDRFQDRLINVLLLEAILNWASNDGIKSFFTARGELGPPRFLIISPTNACNLGCKICHTNAHPHNAEQLSFEEFDQIVSDAEQRWGMHFFLISGGEPFLWNDDGQDLLDLVARHPNSFFMVHTNGTCITDRVADRMAALGTIMPTISVEGFAEHTDDKRGEGTFDRIMVAMARMRARGIPFGICMTATRCNVEPVLSDTFLHEMFERHGALYAMLLPYFPIGRSVSLEKMPTPDERFWMWQRTREVVRAKNYVIADLVNSAPLFGGSMVAGRYNGYLHVNWKGDVTPCTFLHFSPANIRDVYARGGTLNDIYDAPFLKSLREWQRSYGFTNEGPEEQHNWMMPCLVRDHFAVLKELVDQHQPKITDHATRELLENPAYHAWLDDYSRQFRELADPAWKQEYLSM